MRAAGDDDQVGDTSGFQRRVLGPGRRIDDDHVNGVRRGRGEGARQAGGLHSKHKWSVGGAAGAPLAGGRLGINIEHKGSPAGLLDRDGKGEGERGFPAPAFLRDDRYCMQHGDNTPWRYQDRLIVRLNIITTWCILFMLSLSRWPGSPPSMRPPAGRRSAWKRWNGRFVLLSLASSHVGSRPYLGLDGKRGYSEAMESVPLTREAVIARLAAAEPDIRALGVARLALFGSVARATARPNSDVDLLVQFSPGQKSYGRFIALSDLLESLLQRRVELVTTEALSPFLGPRILAEAQDVLRAA